MAENNNLPMQLEVGAEITFMNVTLNSSYSKTEDGYQILIMPSNLDNIATVSIGEMINDVKELFDEKLEQKNVEEKINAVQDVESDNAAALKIDYTKIKFCLKMIYLNIKKKGDKKTIEYAVSVQMVTDKLVPADIKIFKVNSLSFNIWNTKNADILNRMSLTDPQMLS